MGDVRARLSTLWLFAVLNYLYCDIVGLMDPELLRQYLTGNVGGLHLTQGFLLGASILVEIPIAMVLLSRVMKHRANRWANIIAGATMTVVQSSSLFVGSSLAIYYIFFSILEVACTSLVVWYALRWRSSVT
ncbi:MAG: hypothetical protein HYR62_11220 [Actinobacteria bacterium]|nr:hypothetical protein [Actinomycetota bacterium]MBI3686880.1 hypothetical protein [Actinomycetota bacterium]